MDKELKIKTEEKIKDQVQAAKPWKKHKKKIMLLPLLLIAMAVAYYLLSKKIAEPEIKNITLQEHADETIDIDPEAEEVDLFKSVEKRQHLFKIPEKHYLLTPSKGIRYARLAFVLVAAHEKDLDNIEKNEPYILEILNNVMRRSTPEDFEGVAGKEAMRTRLLNAINEQIQPPLVGIHYDVLVLR
jgi:flagellar basal body-associated protein FliL